ncbi:MAG: sulfatase-like hydrolase/transferase, partial [Bacteroidales bacterium]
MKLLNGFTLTSALASSLFATAQPVADKPNIILIMTDQQSYNAISAHADLYEGGYFSTPNIDRIAKSGISFTRTYCTNPVSVPSRFALFTGRYGGQYGIRENQSKGAEESHVRAALSQNGMGNVFSRGGYDTYYGGKVHLPFAGKEGASKFGAPVAYGFENYYTQDERDELGRETARIIDEKANQKADKPFLLVASFLNPHDICLESSTNLSAIVPDKGGKKQPITDCVREMRARANAIDSVEFYKEHAPALPFNIEKTAGFPEMKKSPYQDFPEWYWRKYRWTYGQLVSLVDSHIGHILDALDRNPQLKKNTIIVFTSDHGEMQGAHQTVTKNLPYDECQRVPFIFSGPGIPKGKRDNSLVCNGTDLLPTLCELAHIQAPANPDGLSLAKAVIGKAKAPQRESLYLEGDGFLNIVSGDDKYTLFDGKQT